MISSDKFNRFIWCQIYRQSLFWFWNVNLVECVEQCFQVIESFNEIFNWVVLSLSFSCQKVKSLGQLSASSAFSDFDFNESSGHFVRLSLLLFMDSHIEQFDEESFFLLIIFDIFEFSEIFSQLIKKRVFFHGHFEFDLINIIKICSQIRINTQ